MPTSNRNIVTELGAGNRAQGSPEVTSRGVVAGDMVVEALKYARRGWPVFPVHSVEHGKCTCGDPTCSSVGKHPRTAHGVKDATCNEEAIRRLFCYRNGGIGLATSSGLFVLDIDPRHGGDKTLSALEEQYGALPITLEVRTGGGGRHLFFASQGGSTVKNSVGALGAGVDVRGEGGYVVLPPSIHFSGNRYEWVRESDAAVAPDWLVANLAANQPRSSTKKDAQGKIPEGQRNSTLTSLAGSMRHRGLSFEAILAALITENQIRCDPPLPASEVRGIALSVSRYAPSAATRLDDSEPLDRGPYRIEDGKICFEQIKDHGVVRKPLCNFTAQVEEELVLDDGIEVIRAYLIGGKLSQGGLLPSVRVPVSRFGGMNWVSEQWGFGAIVNAGTTTRDRLREAIQRLSPTPRIKRVFMHTGWREIDGKWVYLTANGAIGQDGFEVDLGAELSRYFLPRVPDNARDGMAHSLRLLDLAPLTVTVPLFAAIYRAPLTTACAPDLSLWLEGQTGSLKSTIAALFLSHFGSFTATALPGAWSSTANQLERRAFVLKDMSFVVDDYAPSGIDARDLELKASRLLRSQGNLSARGRLRADLTERPAYPPRGIIIATGEQHPPGHSVIARTLLIELDRSLISMSALSEAQRTASKLPNAMAGYVQWLAPQMSRMPTLLRTMFDSARHSAVSDGHHLRVPSMFAHLWIGIDCALSYATEIGTVTKAEADSLRSRSSDALREICARQAQSVEGERPSRRFLSVLSTLLTQGRAVLIDRDWELSSYAGSAPMVGWQDEDFLYLMPDAAFNAVARFCRESGEFFPVTRERLLRDLNKEGFSDCSEGRNTATVTLGGRKSRVAKLSRERVETLLGEVIPYGNLTPGTAGTGSER